MSSYKIYPSIGVARVGNAPDKFYIGPETYRGLPSNPDGRPFSEDDFRDADGKLCRQAARFKIYRDTDQGSQEVTLGLADVAAIEWTAHVANKKPSWYEFQTNKGENGYASNQPLRNSDVQDRHALLIDPGPRSISGASAGPEPFSRGTVPSGYAGGHFPPTGLLPAGNDIDTLGELRTDAQGRLLFLGGLGHSGTLDSDPQLPAYANNDGWWDDTSDGPLSAVVVLKDGTCIDCGTAWVIVAPPAYAPEIPNLVTLWDTIFDTAVRAGQCPELCAGGLWRSGPTGYRPNFRTEIGPLLERAATYPWVAAIPPKAHRFDMQRLAAVPGSPAEDENRGLRTWILQVLRAPAEENQIVDPSGRTMMPYLAGDNALLPDTLVSRYLRLTDTQYFFLQQWAEGWFVDADEQGGDPGLALTRAVLENCVGGAFSPGIEMSWISRNAAIYQDDDPLRINADMPASGPLRLDFDPARMQPGDVSRYMAIPWQADFNECSSQPIGPRVLWWWPAQRPEYVYLDPTRAQRAAIGEPEPTLATGGQVAWVGTDFDQKRDDYVSFADNVQMVQYWWRLGFVMRKDTGGTPPVRYVEVARDLPRPFFPPSNGEA